MENNLEQLLNSLVEAGWKPRGLLNEIEYIHAFNDVNQGWRVEISYGDHGYYKALRQIVSKESGLWQFVCENKLYKDYNEDSGTYWDSTMKIYNYRDYQYWLIESSLKDKSELEDFLLNSISLHE